MELFWETFLLIDDNVELSCVTFDISVATLSIDTLGLLRADALVGHESHAVLVMFQHLLQAHGDGLDVLVVLRRQLVADPVEVELEVAGIHAILPVRGKLGNNSARLQVQKDTRRCECVDLKVILYTL